MDIIEFSRNAWLSANHYLKYLTKTKQGCDTIDVTQVIQLDNVKFKLLTSKKVFNQDSAKIIIESVDFSFISEEDTIKILEVNNEELSVTISVKSDYCDAIKKVTPDKIKIISDLRFLVSAVQNWYSKFHDSIVHPQYINVKERKQTVFSLAGASDSQKKAISTALNSKISYIWGAPGTGKTQFVLANCIIEYVKEQKKVLLFAPTNNALEQSTRGIIKILEENGIPTNVLLRLGRASSDFSKEHPEVCESRNLENTLKKIQEEIDSLTNTLTYQNRYLLLIQRLDDAKNIQANLSELEPNAEQLINEINQTQQIKEKFEKEIFELEQTKKFKQLSINMLRKKMNAITSKILFLFSHKKKFKALKQIEDLKSEIRILEKDITSTYDLVSQYQNQIDEMDLNYTTLIKKIEKYNSDIGNISVEVFNINYNVMELISKIQKELEKYDRFTTIPNLEQKISDQNLKYVRLLKSQEAEFKNKLIIACTVDYAILHYEKFPQAIDCGASHVFVDEAAYCPMIKAGVFFSYGLPVTFLGDHMQLPPICEMDDDVIINSNHDIFLWSQPSIYFPEIFVEDNDFDALFKRFASRSNINSNNINVAFLNETYRFGDNLAKILDNYVYHSNFSGVSKENLSITVINAPKNNSIQEKIRENSSEVKAIKRFISTNKPLLKDFSVLTPYKDQRNLLNKALKGITEVLTIHASQGREWDTVIISIVDVHNKWMVDSTSVKSNGLRIINTAISRAKKNVVLVLDFEHWKQLSEEQLIGNIAVNNTTYLDYSSQTAHPRP